VAGQCAVAGAAIATFDAMPIETKAAPGLKSDFQNSKMNHEMQAACIQAAATLLAAKNVVSGAKSVDAGACMRLTEELYENATGERYERASSSGSGAQNPPGRP
jgi:hypothetical protein